MAQPRCPCFVVRAFWTRLAKEAICLPIFAGGRFMVPSWQVLDHALLHDQADALTILGVGDLCVLLAEELERKGIRVTFGQRVVGLGGVEDDAEQAWADVEDSATGKTARYAADYLVGCDGGDSSTYYDFPHAPPDWADTNYISDKEHWYMAAKISHDGLWRITYGDLAGLSREELLARQPTRFEAMLPGNPKPEDYIIINISPYKVHQRCVETMAKGRIALHCGKAHQSILNTYSDVRNKKYQEIVNNVSSGNLTRLCRSDPSKVLEFDETLQKIKKTGNDFELSERDAKFQLQPGAGFRGGMESLKRRD